MIFISSCSDVSNIIFSKPAKEICLIIEPQPVTVMIFLGAKNPKTSSD